MHRVTSGLFYENSTELNEVGQVGIKTMRDNRLSLPCYVIICPLTVEFVLSCDCYQRRNIVEGETGNSAIGSLYQTGVIQAAKAQTGTNDRWLPKIRTKRAWTRGTLSL